MAKSRKSTKPAPEAKSKPEETPGAAWKAGRPAWSGSISFGLVNIPIKLYPGVRVKAVRFHMLHKSDQSRVQEKLFCPADDKEISRQDVVKGYEIADGQNVVITQEELTALAPKASRTIELMNVVDISQIDPMYFDRPFYVLPDERAGKAYSLLVEALETAKKGAIVKFVMRDKEYIGALRPIKKVLCLETMHFGDEIVSADDVGKSIPATQVREPEVKMALQLLESLAGDFEPAKMHDDYREALLHLIQQKAAGQEMKIEPESTEKEPEVIDLMSALEKSIAQVKRQKGRRAA